DECDLTMRDLAVIVDTLERTVTTIYHHRIDYPGFEFNRERTKRRTTETAGPAPPAVPAPKTRPPPPPRSPPGRSPQVPHSPPAGPARLVPRSETKTPKPKTGAVPFLFCGASRRRTLNRVYRRKDRSTDVLAFPAGGGELLGDIVISVPYASRQARRRGEPVS